MSRFNSVLIANRGEIACRIIRTAKSLGYRTVAVYSEADANAPHTRMADDAVCVGANPVNQSYLVIDNIIDAAKQSGSEAIHPGYGFLSENAAFATACHDAGLVFIGPPAEAIELMGNKAESKRRMLAAKVPCVPGYEGEDQSDAAMLAAANKIGAPIMVKAAAGGGGRGMRLVDDLAELPNALKLARSEAQNAFGSGELILEKAIVAPRHVEIQVFADRAGNTIHLGERDCSVQRRHQKVVEEAPCPVMTTELREKMGAAAVAAAESIDYLGAGTVEFLLDSEGAFYFLEMNTRLQVEHPVTELVTGLDLVALQLQVAQGEPLGLGQNDIALSGHAIEVRLYSEDPAQDFLPTSGLVELWKPAGGEGVRVDAGICSGQEISPFYDPMVAKVIASGPSREVARRRLVKALNETLLYGVKNNKAFLIACLQKPAFINGTATTAFIAEEFDDNSLAEVVPSFAEAAAAAVLDMACEFEQHFSQAVDVSPNLRDWSSAGALVSQRCYKFGDQSYQLSTSPLPSPTRRGYLVSEGDTSIEIEILERRGDSARLLMDGEQSDVFYARTAAGGITVSFAGHSAQFIDQNQFAGAADEAAGGGQVTAPMHGMVLELLVESGQRVNKGQALLVLEAMKMQHEIVAATDGTVSEVFAASGAQVSADQLLVEIDVEG